MRPIASRQASTHTGSVRLPIAHDWPGSRICPGSAASVPVAQSLGDGRRATRAILNISGSPPPVLLPLRCAVSGGDNDKCRVQSLQHGNASMSVTLPAVEKALKVYESLLESPMWSGRCLPGKPASGVSDPYYSTSRVLGPSLAGLMHHSAAPLVQSSVRSQLYQNRRTEILPTVACRSERRTSSHPIELGRQVCVVQQRWASGGAIRRSRQVGLDSQIHRSMASWREACHPRHSRYLAYRS